MLSPHERLKLARELRYDTATAAAEALGVPFQTYAPWESGRTKFWHEAVRLADFYGVCVEWLMAERGPMQKGQQHPVVELFEAIPEGKRPQALEYLRFLASQSK